MGVSGIKIKFMILLIKLTNLHTFIGLDELVICFLYKGLAGVQQQSLILLGEVGYMDHTLPFGTVKNQSHRNIIKSKIHLDDFLQSPFRSPLLLLP